MILLNRAHPLLDCRTVEHRDKRRFAPSVTLAEHEPAPRQLAVSTAEKREKLRSPETPPRPADG